MEIDFMVSAVMLSHLLTISLVLSLKSNDSSDVPLTKKSSSIIDAILAHNNPRKSLKKISEQSHYYKDLAYLYMKNRIELGKRFKAVFSKEQIRAKVKKLLDKAKQPEHKYQIGIVEDFFLMGLIKLDEPLDGSLLTNTIESFDKTSIGILLSYHKQINDLKSIIEGILDDLRDAVLEIKVDGYMDPLMRAILHNDRKMVAHLISAGAYAKQRHEKVAGKLAKDACDKRRAEEDYTYETYDAIQSLIDIRHLVISQLPKSRFYSSDKSLDKRVQKIARRYLQGPVVPRC